MKKTGKDLLKEEVVRAIKKIFERREMTEEEKRIFVEREMTWDEIIRWSKDKMPDFYECFKNDLIKTNSDDYAAARDLHNEALELRQQVLYNGHSDIATNMSGLADAWSKAKMPDFYNCFNDLAKTNSDDYDDEEEVGGFVVVTDDEDENLGATISGESYKVVGLEMQDRNEVF